MEKRIIKIIINEKQQEIVSTELIERPIFLEESCCYPFSFAETFELKDKRSWINSLYLKILLGDIITPHHPDV